RQLERGRWPVVLPGLGRTRAEAAGPTPRLTAEARPRQAEARPGRGQLEGPRSGCRGEGLDDRLAARRRQESLVRATGERHERELRVATTAARGDLPAA